MDKEPVIKKDEVYIEIEKKELLTDDEKQQENKRLRHISGEYFDKMRKEQINNSDDESALYEAFLKKQQSSLESLTYSKELNENKKWDTAASALAEVSFIMALSKQDFLYNRDLKAEEDVLEDALQKYEKSKDIFMTFCAKLLPDEKIEVNTSSFLTEISRLKNLNESFGGAFTSSTSEIRKLIETNPREMARMIDDVEYSAGENVRRCAYDSFIKDLDQEFDEKSKNIPNSVLSLYRLELMRNELNKKIYGDRNLSLKEQKQVDEIRVQLNK